MGHVVEVIEVSAVREDWVDVDLLDVWQVRHTVHRHVQIFLCGQDRNGDFRIFMVFKSRKVHYYEFWSWT